MINKLGELSPCEKENLIHVYPSPERIKPHPDGRAWDKCCSLPGGDTTFSCQCLMKRTTMGSSRYEESCTGNIGLKALVAAGGRFFCVHRSTEDGYLRECSGWAAKFTKNPTIRSE